MEATLKFEIGERTCAVEPGKFCRFFRVARFGTVPTCLLFSGLNKGNGVKILAEKDGWVQRCQECLDEFGTSEEQAS